MDAPELFAVLVGITISMAVTGAFFGTQLGFTLSVPSFSYEPPQSISEYQPPQASLSAAADWWGAFNMLGQWIGNLPSFVSQVMGVFGVPPLLVHYFAILAAIILAGFWLYVWSGRKIFQR